MMTPKQMAPWQRYDHFATTTCKVSWKLRWKLGTQRNAAPSEILIENTSVEKQKKFFLAWFSRINAVWYNDIQCNVNPGLINPRLFIWGGYNFNSQLLLFGGTTKINQPGFINPELTWSISLWPGIFCGFHQVPSYFLDGESRSPEARIQLLCETWKIGVRIGIDIAGIYAKMIFNDVQKNGQEES